MVHGNTTRKVKPAKNSAWSLQSVDKHIIAYVHIIICIYVSAFMMLTTSQTYITLIHADHWTHMIGKMNLEQTYWHIIELLDDKSDLWVRKTLAW